MDETLLKNLVEERLSANQIANRVGKSESSVWRALRKYGLKTFRHIDQELDSKTKLCRYCGNKKGIEEFPVSGVVKEKTYYRNKCNECYVAMKSDRRKKNQDWYKELKRSLSCDHCGNDDFRVLEFHHEKDKEDNVINLVSKGWSRENVLKEIEKCIPLCANCHRILHYEERNGKI